LLLDEGKQLTKIIGRSNRSQRIQNVATILLLFPQFKISIFQFAICQSMRACPKCIALLIALVFMSIPWQVTRQDQARSMVITRYGIVATEHQSPHTIGADILLRRVNAVDLLSRPTPLLAFSLRWPTYRRAIFRHSLRGQIRQTLWPKRQRLVACGSHAGIFESQSITANAHKRHPFRNRFGRG